jgi:hypothetical protein
VAGEVGRQTRAVAVRPISCGTHERTRHRAVRRPPTTPQGVIRTRRRPRQYASPRPPARRKPWFSPEVWEPKQTSPGGRSVHGTTSGQRRWLARKGGSLVVFHVVDPLEVTHGGATVPIGALSSRALLGLLPVNADEPVRLRRFVEAVWDDSAPRPAAGLSGKAPK